MTLTRREFVAAAASAALGAGENTGQTSNPAQADIGILELRQYTLHKNQRDILIALFEEKFLDSQNLLGAQVLGTFRDMDDPDRFVWLRGFRDLEMRQRSLEAFYGGAAWRSNREAANATMLDSDNVLLLRPAMEGHPFLAPAVGGRGEAVIGARIYYLNRTPPESFSHFFDQTMVPRLLEMNVRPIGRFVTHNGPNNFRLPIREHEPVYIWFARWSSVQDEEDFSRRWSALSGWRDGASEDVLPALMRKPERLRLSPTVRSPLR